MVNHYLFFSLSLPHLRLEGRVVWVGQEEDQPGVGGRQGRGPAPRLPDGPSTVEVGHGRAHQHHQPHLRYQFTCEKKLYDRFLAPTFLIPSAWK